MKDLHFLELTDLAELIRTRRISPVEATRQQLDRIAALDDRLASYAIVTADRAMAEAQAAETDIAAGRYRGPLHGVPLAVKDLFWTRGVPTAAGTTIHKDFRPDVDATAVRRLREAGAVLLGKLQMTEGAYSDHHPQVTPPRNPWNADYWPGISSSGPGVAVAAGLCFGALASETGGSIRWPSAANGLTGIKPTWGRVSRHGVFDLAPSLDHVGPMARSAADLALELGVLAGPDELMEGVGYKLALPPPRREKLADFRVLVIDTHPLCPTADSIRSALNGLADRLANLGCRVLRKSPKLPDLARTTRTYVELLAAVYSLDLSPDERARSDAAAKALSPEDQSLAAYRLRGITANHAEWIRASRVRAALRGQWFNVFQEVDIVLCPPMPSLAFPHDHAPQRSRQLDIDGSKIPYYDLMAWAGIATLNGLPATTMPNGRSESGLPIGVQIIGGYLEDRSTIAFAGLIEREFVGFTPPPI
jgi:amidase